MAVRRGFGAEHVPSMVVRIRCGPSYRAQTSTRVRLVGEGSHPVGGEHVPEELPHDDGRILPVGNGDQDLRTVDRQSFARRTG